MEHLIHKGVRIPLIGLGTYGFGLNEKTILSEENTVKRCIEKYGMTLIDTAECYGDGKSETFIGNIIKNYDREDFFIVDKILPQNAKNDDYFASCKKSLDRLGIQSIDLYLLHWREGLELQSVVNAMESLVSSGMIKHWGVSNFDTSDMIELFACENGSNCFCNQILYNICTRGPEYDLIPWCKEHGVLIMAYSPLCHYKENRQEITCNSFIQNIADNENKTPESLMLSFVIRNRDIVTVFKTSDIKRLDNNMKNVFSPISEENNKTLSQFFKTPTKRTKLKTI